MKEKKLLIRSLPEALKDMKIGQTCIAPDNCTHAYVKTACSSLKKEGYLFSTSAKSGVQTVTRLK